MTLHEVIWKDRFVERSLDEFDLPGALSMTKTNAPIPEQFLNYDEAAEFWGSHDTTHYSDVFRTVDVVGDLKRRRYEIEIDAGLANTLQSKARRKGATVSSLASHLIRRQLAAVK